MDETPAYQRLQAKHLPLLDGWRGVAVLAVVVYHMYPRPPHGGMAVSFGWVGVDLFFVLSGFLITRILLAARDRPNYFRNFYARRTLRIFPLYYAVVVAVCVIWPLLGPSHESVGAVASHAAVALAYVTNLWQAHYEAWFTAPPPFTVGHFWSLAVEEQFYLAWPVVVLVARDRRWLLAACGACVVVSNGCRLALWVGHANAMLPFVLTPCRLDGLGLGAAMAVAVTRPGWVAVARACSWVGLGVALPAFLAVGIRSHTFDRANSYVVRTVGLTASAPLCAAALFLSATAPVGGLANRGLCLAPLRWLGKYSYGLYVYHGLLGTVLTRCLGRPAGRLVGGPPAVADAVTFAVSAAVIVAVSVASFHLFEQPILRLKRHFPEPPPGSAVTPAAGAPVVAGRV